MVLKINAEVEEEMFEKNGAVACDVDVEIDGASGGTIMGAMANITSELMKTMDLTYDEYSLMLKYFVEQLMEGREDEVRD